MKQITELSEEEILQLTDEQLSKMVKFKMAEAGVKIIDAPVKPVLKDIPEKDVEAFSVTGLNYIVDKEISAMDIAQEISRVAASFLNYSYGSDYTAKMIKPLDAITKESIGQVKKERYYSPELFAEVNLILKESKEIEEAYKKELADYNTVKEQADTIAIEVYTRYNEVVNKYADMERHKARYEEYLSLADGNAEIAMKFLKKAYSIDEQTEYYVQGREIPEEEPEGYATTARSEGGY